MGTYQSDGHIYKRDNTFYVRQQDTQCHAQQHLNQFQVYPQGDWVRQ